MSWCRQCQAWRRTKARKPTQKPWNPATQQVNSSEWNEWGNELQVNANSSLEDWFGVIVTSFWPRLMKLEYIWTLLIMGEVGWCQMDTMTCVMTLVPLNMTRLLKKSGNICVGKWPGVGSIRKCPRLENLSQCLPKSTQILVERVVRSDNSISWELDFLPKNGPTTPSSHPSCLRLPGFQPQDGKNV